MRNLSGGSLDRGDFELYRYIFKSEIDKQPIRILGDGVYTTLHEGDGRIYAVAINYTDTKSDIEIVTEDYKLRRVLYGSADGIMAYDATVLEFIRKQRMEENAGWRILKKRFWNSRRRERVNYTVMAAA